MVEIRFETPPDDLRSHARPRGWHAETAKRLRRRPAEWAVIDARDTAQKAGGMAYAIRAAQLRAYEPAGAFQAVARKVEGEYRIYARFVGEGD